MYGTEKGSARAHLCSSTSRAAVCYIKTTGDESGTVEHSRLIFYRPRLTYQYFNMAPGLSGQTSIFGGVFFVSRSLLGIERQRKLKKTSNVAY